MALGIVLEETMSGWIRLDEDGVEEPFSFSIRAFTPHLFSMSTPREFRGVARVGSFEAPTRGVLTIRPTGPRYELDFEHPRLGKLHAAGKKNYSARPGGIIRSLVTCPLTVFRDGQPIGKAEVAYRDSKLGFLFKAVRLVREEKAFGAWA